MQLRVAAEARGIAGSEGRMRPELGPTNPSGGVEPAGPDSIADAVSGLRLDTAWGSKGGRSDQREQAVPSFMANPNWNGLRPGVPDWNPRYHQQAWRLT